MENLEPIVEIFPKKSVAMIQAQGQGEYYFNQYLLGKIDSEELVRKIDYVGRTYDIEFYATAESIYVEDKPFIFYSRN